MYTEVAWAEGADQDWNQDMEEEGKLLFVLMEAYQEDITVVEEDKKIQIKVVKTKHVRPLMGCGLLFG